MGLKQIRKKLDEIPPLAQGPWKLEAFLVALVTFGVYLYTTPRVVTLEDSGLFLMASHFGGVAHPPGYPLHSILGKLFTWLPVGSVAFRVHLLSGPSASLTCAAVFWIARSLIGRSGPAWAAGLAYGFSLVFWSQAIVAEVYTLNTLLTFLLLACCLGFASSGNPRLLPWIGLFYGLGLSNHWPLIQLAVPGLLLLLWPRRRLILRRLHLALPLVLVGLLSGSSGKWGGGTWFGAFRIPNLVPRSLNIVGCSSRGRGNCGKLRATSNWASKSVIRSFPSAVRTVDNCEHCSPPELLVFPRFASAVSAACLWAPHLPDSFLSISGLDPLISFYGPLKSLEDLLFFVSRKGYSQLEASSTASWVDQVQFAGFLLQQSWVQFTAVGAGLAILGCWFQWRRWTTGVSLALVWGFLSGGLLLTLVLAFDFELLQRSVMRVYPLVSYGVMALWIGLAIDGCTRFLTRRIRLHPEWVGGAAAAGLVSLVAVSNFSYNDKREETWARDYAQTILSALPPDAVLFTHGDNDTGPIGSLHYIDGVRPDVEVYNDQGLIFSNRLFPARSSRRQKDQAIESLVRESKRPVCFVQKPTQQWATRNFGLFHLIEKKAHDPRSKRLSPTSPVLDWCDRVERRQDLSDPWLAQHRTVLLESCSRLLSPLVHLSQNQDFAKHAPLLDRVTSHFRGKLALIDELIHTKDTQLLWTWSEEAMELVDEDVSKATLARLYYLRGHLLVRMNRRPEAEENFARSISVYPNRNENGAILNLLELYAGKGDRANYQKIKRTYFLDELPEQIRKRLAQLDQLVETRSARL